MTATPKARLASVTAFLITRNVTEFAIVNFAVVAAAVRSNLDLYHSASGHAGDQYKLFREFAVREMMDRIEIRAGRPPKERAEALGDHVVAVADALFIENGYGATSMATVASRARVGKQTLYRRFPDKPTLFREVIRRRIDATIVSPGDGVVNRDPLGELKKLGRAALDIVLDPEFVRLYRVIIAEALPFPELACAASDHWGSSLKDRCIDAVRKAQAARICIPGDPEALAQCFLLSLIGDVFLKGLSGQESLSCKGDRDGYLELVWCVFLNGISILDEQRAE